MPGRLNPLQRQEQCRIAAVVTILLAVICNQSLRGQTETNATNSASSGFAAKWQSAKEGSSNAWETIKQGSVNAWENTKEGSSNAWSSVKEGFESASAKTNYVFAKKDEFVAESKEQLAQLDEKIKQLSGKMTSAGTSAQTDAQQKLDDIKSQRADLGKKYDAAKAATEADWQKAQVEFENAYDQTTNSVMSAWDWVKSKAS